MEFFFGIIAAVGGFFGGLFGGTEVPDPVVEVPVVEEVIVATTTEEVAPEAPFAPAPKSVTPTVSTKPVAPVVPAVVTPVPVVATTTATTTVQKTSLGSSSTSSTSLSITSPKLSSVTEEDELSFTATFKKSDGSTEDVTEKAAWEVVGPIGSISKGVFTAKLSSEFAEFGAAPGAVRVTYQGMSAETDIFEVEAFVPEVINTKGQ
ncbi:hypothetical protein K2Y00_02230 [Patescibacteria group bacterium]|nr:hypothetical protein [Patescibacteria group bacterium]